MIHTGRIVPVLLPLSKKENQVGNKGKESLHNKYDGLQTRSMTETREQKIEGKKKKEGILKARSLEHNTTQRRICTSKSLRTCRRDRCSRDAIGVRGTIEQQEGSTLNQRSNVCWEQQHK